MSKNKIVMWVIIGLVIIGGVFYGGMKYGQNNANGQGGAGNFNRGLQTGSSTARGNRSFGGMVSGQILSIDNNSLTISSQTGGSRIVFLSASTTIGKMSTGSVGDLIVGSNVSVNGTSNTDNSINAQIIQIRPQLQPK